MDDGCAGSDLALAIAGRSCTIRDERVMRAPDLTALYRVLTGTLNQVAGYGVRGGCIPGGHITTSALKCSPLSPMTGLSQRPP